MVAKHANPSIRMPAVLNPARYLCLVVLGMALAACAGPTVESLRDPVPEPLVTQSAVPGYKNIRYWGDDGDGLSPDIAAEISAQQKASPPKSATSWRCLVVAATEHLAPACCLAGRPPANARNSPSSQASAPAP